MAKSDESDKPTPLQVVLKSCKCLYLELPESIARDVEQNVRAALDWVREEQKREDLAAVPTNWMDSLLTGKDRVIGDAPYTDRDIEKLLQAVAQRIKGEE